MSPVARYSFPFLLFFHASAERKYPKPEFSATLRLQTLINHEYNKSKPNISQKGISPTAVGDKGRRPQDRTSFTQSGNECAAIIL